jgi:hypothetical protein
MKHLEMRGEKTVISCLLSLEFREPSIKLLLTTPRGGFHSICPDCRLSLLAYDLKFFT